MVESQTIKLTIEKIVFGGSGLGFYQGQAVFVPHTAPGDHIQAVVEKTERNALFARCVQIFEKGPDRVDPGCLVYEQCGGCQFRHLNVNLQITAKESIVLETLHRFPTLRSLVKIEPLLTTEQQDGYRRRASLKVRWTGSRLLLGFFQTKSHRICDIPPLCSVLDHRLSTLTLPLRQLITSLSIRHKLFHVDMMAGDNSLGLVIHVLRTPNQKDQKLLQQFVKEQTIDQLWIQQGRKPAMRQLVYQKALSYDLQGDTLTFRPGDFIQAHAMANRLMVEQIIHWIGQGDMVWDLFCGVGNFTIPLARHFSQVLAVEGDAPTLKRARENAKRCEIETISFIKLNLFLESGIELLGQQKPADLVVLDPPREGAFKLIQWLAQTPPKKVLYISCNPATFARDADHLVKYGYVLEKVQPMELFPQTFHVELMALFSMKLAVSHVAH